MQKFVFVFSFERIVREVDVFVKQIRREAKASKANSNGLYDVVLQRNLYRM